MPQPKVTNIDPLAYLDTKQSIIDRLGNCLENYEIAQNEVLLAIYIRPDETAGGIILTQRNRIEDRYQGKASLVLKIGSACRFVRDEYITNPVTGERTPTGLKYGIPIAVGDWVLVRPSDTWALDISPNMNSNDMKDLVPCRMCFDDGIRGKLPHPALVW